MPGSLAELYGALLKQEPQGILSAARFNPLMMAKALRQQQERQPPTSVMDPRWDAFKKNQDSADAFLTMSDIAMTAPMLAPLAKAGALALGRASGPLAEQYMARTGMLQPMTVWQGSPHRFAPTKNNPLGEFDATKIGSGEGAQAYGYGHYLAENPAVASEYITAGKNMGFLNWDTPDQIATKAFAVSKGDKNAAMKFIEENIASMKSGAKKENFEIAKKILSEGRQSGSLYKVDLPDDQIAKMLDWDKPLSQQAPEVQKFFAPYAEKMRKIEGGRSGSEWGDLAAPRTYDPTGNELLRLISKSDRMTAQSVLNGGFGPEISEKLRAAGIPGIRYLDGGSRAGGQGTSNFVVFPGNEGILKILARE